MISISGKLKMLHQLNEMLFIYYYLLFNIIFFLLKQIYQATKELQGSNKIKIKFNIFKLIKFFDWKIKCNIIRI